MRIRSGNNKINRRNQLLKFTNILILLSLMFLSFSGCTNLPTNPSTPANISSTSISPSSTPAGGAPSPSIYIDISFPDGAPSLNETKELICTINTPGMKTDTTADLKVVLPEALELISGQLSWEGIVPSKSSFIAIKIGVKSIKTGNWTINGQLDTMPKPGGQGQRYGGNYEMYVSISDNSAEWRRYPPYTDESASPTGIHVVTPTENIKNLPSPPAAPVQSTSGATKAPASPLKVELSVSSLPLLNVPFDLICTLSSQSDISKCNT
jgi:hypothetical protein